MSFSRLELALRQVLRKMTFLPPCGLIPFAVYLTLLMVVSGASAATTWARHAA